VTDTTEGTRFPFMIAPSEKNEDSVFCKLDFESSPLDGHADAVASLKVAPLDVVIHRIHLEQFGM
jgi:hypothetical protein